MRLLRDAKDLIRWQHNTVQVFRSSRTGWRHVVSPNLLLRNTGRIINPALLQRRAPKPKSLVFGFSSEGSEPATPLSASPGYTSYRQLVIERRAIEETDEYRHAVEVLKKKNKVNGYRGITAEMYMETRIALFRSLAKNGMLRDSRWRFRHSCIGVVVERDGELAICGSGFHRLAFAHGEGLSAAFVDVVGIHVDNISEIAPQSMPATAGIAALNRILDRAIDSYA